MAVDSYLNVLVYSDGIFKGSPWSLSSTNDTVETFFYDWVSFSFFLFFNSIIIFFFFPKTNSARVVSHLLLKYPEAPRAD